MRKLWLSLVLLLALLPGSPSAVQAGGTTFTVNSTMDAVDANPGDGVCDDGAGNCTLRAAIMEANALAGADTITLPTGTYLLSIAGAGEDAAVSGDLDTTGDLTITGAGHSTTIIDAAGGDRVFHIISGSTVNISGVTIRGGTIDDSGGGILNSGTATLSSSIVAGNSATGSLSGGGGVRNDDFGTMTISDSTVSANSTQLSSLATAQSATTRLPTGP